MKVTIEDRKQLKRVLKGLGRKRTREDIFYDLCFCICAPQTTFKSNIKVIQELKDYNFYEKPIDLFMGTFQKEKNKLKEILKPVRFYNNKGRYLLEAKKNFNIIMLHVNIYLKCVNFKGVSEPESKRKHPSDMRQYLVDEVKGLGMKAASHFLRNLGCENLAIIDVHIIKFLASQEIKSVIYVSERSSFVKTLEDRYRRDVTSIKGYEKLESWFQTIAEHMDLTTAELDALVWKKYSNTDWKAFKY